MRIPRFDKLEIFGAAIVALFGIALVLVSAAGAPRHAGTACVADQWQCAEWTVCAEDGAQTRRCSMTYDCPGRRTDKPEESRVCANVARGCDGTSWSCGDWSACDADGAQSRDCVIAAECPGATTQKPESVRTCADLCESADAEDRIRCVLRLSAAGRAVHAAQSHLPEGCRGLDAGAREQCAAAVASFASCHGARDEALRLSCARTALALSTDPCGDPQDDDARNCAVEATYKERFLTLFRMEDLAWYAARRDDEAGEPTIAFLAATADAESAYLAATNAAGRTAALETAQTAWTRLTGSASPWLPNTSPDR